MQDLIPVGAGAVDPFTHLIKHLLLNLGYFDGMVRSSATEKVHYNLQCPLAKSGWNKASRADSVTWLGFMLLSSQALTTRLTVCSTTIRAISPAG